MDIYIRWICKCSNLQPRVFFFNEKDFFVLANTNTDGPLAGKREHISRFPVLPST